MDWFCLTIGIVVVLAALIDTIWTTLWVGGGAGPITRAASHLIWRIINLVGSHRLMTIAGPLVLTFTIVTWLSLLWLGWFLIFWSYPPSLLATSTETVADSSDRIYFVGYTIFTLGNGDFSPNGAIWKFLTALASGMGLFTATLAITYLSIASQLTKLSQQYLAYPVFQYFHSDQAAKSPIVSLARLDQVLLIASHGVPGQLRSSEVILNSTRSAIADVLESLPRQFAKPANDPLPVPSLDALRSRGQPAVSAEEFTSAIGSELDRRRRLRGLLNAHGWGVDDV